MRPPRALLHSADGLEHGANGPGYSGVESKGGVRSAADGGARRGQEVFERPDSTITAGCLPRQVTSVRSRLVTRASGEAIIRAVRGATRTVAAARTGSHKGRSVNCRC